MRGYLPHSVVKGAVFWTLVMCILSATVAGVLAAWEVIGPEASGRWVTSATVLGCGSLAFLFLNMLFGEMGASLFTRSQPPHRPEIDPAFGERLRRAKAGSKDERDSLAG